MNLMCNLGVFLDSQLLLEQVLAMAKRAFAHLVCTSCIQEDLFIVSHALETSHLDYCHMIYIGLYLRNIQKLQQGQNVAARVLNGVNYMIHVRVALFVGVFPGANQAATCQL